MKFKRKQTSEVMPSFGLLESVTAEKNDFRFVLNQVRLPELLAMRSDSAARFKKGDVLGVPTYFAIAENKKARLGKQQILEVFPAPDQDVEIKVRYYPPMEER